MQLTCIFDSSGIEKKRHKDLIDHAAKEAEENATKNREKERKKAQKIAKIAQIKLIFDKAIEKLKGKNLQDQVDAFVQAEATLYKRKANISKVAQKKEAIQKIIDRYNEGLWTLKTSPSEDNDIVQADVADEDSDEE